MVELYTMMQRCKSRIKLEHCRVVYCRKKRLKMLDSNFNAKQALGQTNIKIILNLITGIIAKRPA